jgi:hypothetical protein
MKRVSVNQQAMQFVERLESRQFMSASPAGAITPALASDITPKLAVKFGPAAVEGTYKGDTKGETGVIYEIKVVITSTSAKLTVVGLGTYAAKLSAKQFKLIREGTFAVEFIAIDGSKGSAAFVGGVTDKGLRISGSYTNSAGKSGSFTLKKG